MDPTPQNQIELRIRDLRLDVAIGVLPEEHGRKQPVIFNLWLRAAAPAPARLGSDDIADYVSYADVVDGIKDLVGTAGHIKLVETLAEKVAALALDDPRVLRVRVSVEKPDIIAEAAAVGVTIERSRRR